MKTAVVCSVKDEAPYILDWVGHYRALGFDDILLFQNDSVDGTDDLCRTLAKTGHVIYFDNSNPKNAPASVRHFPAQRRAYGWAQLVLEEADMMFLVDIDEYLDLPRDDTFQALVDRLERPDVISMPWRVFGSNGQTGFDPAPVTDRFTFAAHPTSQGGWRAYHQIKSAFSPRLTQKFNVHKPILSKGQIVRWLAPDGSQVAPRLTQGNVLAKFDYEFANLRHYHVKSLAEFKLKMVRGYASHGSKKLPQLGLPAFKSMDVNEVELPFEGAICQKGRNIAAKLRENPRISKAERSAMEKFERMLHLADAAIDKLPVFKTNAAFHADLDGFFETEIYSHMRSEEG